MVKEMIRKLKENFSQERMNQKYHRIKLNVRTNIKYQLAIYAVVLGLILLLLFLIVSSGQNKQVDFVNYQIKKCYDKKINPSNESSSINYALNKNKAIIEYTFNQRCYKRAEVLPKKDANHIEIQLITSDYVEDDCFCNSRLLAEIGVEPGTYTLDLTKKSGAEAFLLKSEKIVVK